MRLRTLAACTVIALLAACANPAISQLSGDTYVLFREDHGGIFGSPASLKAGVIRDANAFAESQGKVAVPLSMRDKPLGAGPAQWASFEYQFRLVDKNDPAAKRLRAVPSSISEQTTVTQGSADVYAELLKLDDLRKRGVISDAEFEARKKKILAEN